MYDIAISDYGLGLSNQWVASIKHEVDELIKQKGKRCEQFHRVKNF